MKKLILLLLTNVLMIALYAQQKKVMIMEIKSEIDPRMKRYVELALRHAEETKADIVIIDMNTYGGALTDAKDIVDAIMDFEKPVWVFINSNAASAGALISIACDSIYMSPGASIGAATVVTGNGERAPDKYQSYMRSIMRATAEERKRDPRIAEGMVDETFKIDSVKKEGQVITFSTSEAIRYGYCEGKAVSIDDLLRQNKIDHPVIDHFNLSTTDTIIDFFMNPFISGILILIILGGIYFELQTPGAVLPGAAAAIALVLYLIPYYLNGLAENWEILALFIGILFLALEIFVIPGFGIAGVIGIGLTVGSLVLIMVNNRAFDFHFVPLNELLIAIGATAGGLAGSVLLLFLGGARLANSKAFHQMALTDTQKKSLGYTSSGLKEPMTGKTGVAHTVLRPSGRVMIEGQVYDAFTRGDYVEKGTRIEVVSEEGSTLRVRAI
jgi:membrane-bound serine protease (ClpP class)